MKKIKGLSVLVILIVVSICACGRTPSRLLGKEHRQILEIEGLKNNSTEYIISVSFDKRGGSTVKDVTYLAKDGFYYTKEFKDVSPLEGSIRWVPHDADDSFIQSRALSRLTRKAVNLRLPEDFVKIVNVDIGYKSKDERVKNLVYINNEGLLLSKEYQEGFIDRHLSGWLEVKAK